ncbi:T9SS type A sorting domain-containing protein [Candidatus Calescamantes bacterium]|nr:T9SS type A sorting domain-containing protein [Candidatus Calescamantes bacterium]
MKRITLFTIAILILTIGIASGQYYQIWFEHISHLPFSSARPYSMGMEQNGNYLYTADFPVDSIPGGLTIVDISDLNFPREVAFCPVAENLDNWSDVYGYKFTEVKVMDTLAYLAMADSGLIIISIANPEAPRTIGKWNREGLEYDVNHLTLFFPYLYAGTPSGVHIIDVSDPTEPEQIGWFHPDTSLTFPGIPFGHSCITDLKILSPCSLAVLSQRYAYLVDVTDLANPRELAHRDVYLGYPYSPHFTESMSFLPDSSAMIMSYRDGLGIVDFDYYPGYIYIKWVAQALFEATSAIIYQDSFVIACNPVVYSVWATSFPHNDEEWDYFRWSWEAGGISFDYLIPDSIMDRIWLHFKTIRVKQNEQDPDSVFFVTCGQGGLFIFQATTDSASFDDIKENSEAENVFQVFPNPCNSTVNLTVPLGQWSLEVRNILGQIVKEMKINSCQMNIDLTDFPSGIYLFTVSGPDNQMFSKKVVILE